jgi:glycerol uptake facilitator-like aquaporin
MFGRKKVAMLVAEFLGTGVLTLVVLAVQRSTIGVPYFVAIAAGLAVAALSLIFGSISGAHFNPAITIGLWSARKVRTLPAISYVVVQLLGGWAAYGIYGYFVNNSLQKIGGNFTARVLIAEAVGAFIFAVIWAAVSAQRLAASAVGAGLTLGLIVASSASIALLNPAVALGTRAWTIWGSLGWGTYVLGPVVGAVIGFNLYQLLFAETEGTTVVPAKANSVALTGRSTVKVTKPAVATKTTVAKTAAKAKAKTTRKK